MKKFLAIFLCLVMVLSFAACGNEPAAPAEPAAPSAGTPAASDDPFADGPTVNLIFATSWNDAIFYGAPAREICEKVAEETNGKITIQCAFESSLGSDAEMLESTVAGDVAFVNLPAAGITPYIPEAAILEAPMLYNSVEEADAVMKMYDEAYLNQFYEELGLVNITSCCADFRVMTNNKYMETIDDFKGMIIRTQENKYLMGFWSAVGASPTYVAFPELAVSLQQGVVDGQENPITGITYTKGIQKYVYDTNCTAQMDHIWANKDIWEGLPEAYREYLTGVFESITQYRYDNFEAKGEAVIATLPSEYGAEYVQISDELRADLRECANAAYDMYREDLGDEAVDKMFECIAEYRGE